MSTLYIRHPSRVSLAGADADGLAPAPLCRFALVADSGTVMQQGSAALGALTDVVGLAAKVVLLLAASDVSLLRVKAPPLAGSRLKAALPHLVEEQLISDPSECVVVAASSVAAAHDNGDGLLRVAVVQRTWLTLLVETLLAQGARHIAALPAQLCLPLAPDTAFAAIGETGANHDVELTLRLGRYDGVGLAVAADHLDPDGAALQALSTLQALAPGAALQVLVPAAHLPSYQRAADGGKLAPGLSVSADQWAVWLPGASEQTLDLASGLELAAGGGLNLRRWRWPLVLAALVAAINIVALNADWWRLKREADTQQALLLQTFKAAYPGETVIVDPVAQMRQKIAAAKLDSGRPAADDFLALAAAFGQAWTGMAQSRAGMATIASLDYRDRALVVKFKSDGEMPFDAVKTALAGSGIALNQQASGVWQIKSGK